MGMLGWLVLLGAPALADDGGGLVGEWKTTLGVVTFAREGGGLSATFKGGRIPAAKGTWKDGAAGFSYREGDASGEASVKPDASGRSFSGWFRFGNGPQTPWEGWRPDPEAGKGEPAAFGGLWLTSLGLMELEQDGAKVRGRFALRGTSKIEGEAKGRRLDFRFRAFLTGKGWYELTDDGKTLDGAAVDDGRSDWFAWRGRPAPEFRRHAPLVAGKTVDGSTKGLLTYSARAPGGYKAGDPKRWPAVVLLHGSNMKGRDYVETFAAAWPDLADRFLLLGVNGERPSDLGPEPRFNFTYANYVGRSKHGGFPGTDRESPALVSEALDELKGVYPVARYLVGGHSQGGFLAYSLLMNFPEKVAGAFPVSAAVINQCVPDAYDDPKVREAQRRVPLAIVHGKNDPVVGFEAGRYASLTFGEAGWAALRLFTSERAGHMFALLPVGEAVAWLDGLTTDDPRALVAFAESRARAGDDRSALFALGRLPALKPAGDVAERASALSADVEARAKAGAEKFLPLIQNNADAAWVDGFLDYRDAYQRSDAARETLAAFDALRARHEAPAREAYERAGDLFRQDKADDGYAKYREVVERWYASPLYRNVKHSLDARPKN